MNYKYFFDYLKNYLQQVDDPRQDDKEFIGGRVDYALCVYEGEEGSGTPAPLEIAIKALMEGIERVPLQEIPETMKVQLGEDVTNVISFEELDTLINNMEDLPAPLIYHPIVFTIGEKGNIYKVGFDGSGNAIFMVDDKIKFLADEDYWMNVNFDDLQNFVFGADSGEYHILEGSFTGEYLEEEI